MNIRLNLELHNKEKILSVKTLFYIILTFVLSIEFNADYRENSTIRFGSIALLMLVTALVVIIYRKINMSGLILWEAGFICFLILSCLWSLNPGNSFQMIKNVIIIFAILFCLNEVIHNEKDFEVLMHVIIIVCFIECLYILSIVGINNVGDARLGRDYDDLQNWNANFIGSITSIGFILCFYFLGKSGKIKKIILLLCMLMFIFITFNTGSRKAIIFISGIILIDMLFKEKGNKRIRNIILALIIVWIIYTLIMSVPQLYEMIGKRMSNVSEVISTGHTNKEHSANIRLDMIKSGFQWFKSKPLIGYGIDSYRYLLLWNKGMFTYSHCNYIELLVGVGIIGLVIYYSIYVIALVKLIILLFKKDERNAAFFSALLVMTFINHAFLVSYTDTIYNIMFFICYNYAYIKSHEKNNVLKEILKKLKIKIKC